MMAIMQDGNNSQEEVPKEFLDTGRTGRRNALPDILSADSEVTTADLPTRLQMLATNGELTTPMMWLGIYRPVFTTKHLSYSINIPMIHLYEYLSFKMVRCLCLWKDWSDFLCQLGHFTFYFVKIQNLGPDDTARSILNRRSGLFRTRC